VRAEAASSACTPNEFFHLAAQPAAPCPRAKVATTTHPLWERGVVTRRALWRPTCILGHIHTRQRRMLPRGHNDKQTSHDSRSRPASSASFGSMPRRQEGDYGDHSERSRWRIDTCTHSALAIEHQRHIASAVINSLAHTLAPTISTISCWCAVQAALSTRPRQIPL
jgi:hypothetical protein